MTKNIYPHCSVLRGESGPGTDSSVLSVDNINVCLCLPGVGCGGTLTGINGSLTSPGYPGNYTSASTCSWLVQVPERRVVTMTFTDIRMFDAVNCETDYVIVYNGDSDVAPQFSRFCGPVSTLLYPCCFDTVTNKILIVD
mgnify:FL=1